MNSFRKSAQTYLILKVPVLFYVTPCGVFYPTYSCFIILSALRAYLPVLSQTRRVAMTVKEHSGALFKSALADDIILSNDWLWT